LAITRIRQRRHLGIHAPMLNCALDRIDALREQSLYPFIEEQPWTVCELVDHARRQIIRQFPLGFDLDQ
jgi:hypothetical protein